MPRSLNGDLICSLDKFAGSKAAYVSSPHAKDAGLPMAAFDCTSRPRSGSPGTIAWPPATTVPAFGKRVGVSDALDRPWL